jgi:sugar/nucleoside kinase (ribokinase family)
VLAKTFKYTTPPLKSTPPHLFNTPLLTARAIHFFATAEEICSQIPEFLQLRGNTERPFIVWEPFPAACKPANKHAILGACGHVDVFSPNHLEFTALFEDADTSGFDEAAMERRAVDFAKATRSGIVVVRCGEHGSLTISPDKEPLWLPPYYPRGAKEVVDPTGAGNAFLGGFTAGWMKNKDARDAAIYGSVASSFAIEQIGLPTLGVEGQDEVWNGVRVEDRLDEYRLSLDM